MGSILVVEDDTPVRKAISRVLTRRDQVVMTASDGAVALDKVKGIPLTSSSWASTCPSWMGGSSWPPIGRGRSRRHPSSS